MQPLPALPALVSEIEAGTGRRYANVCCKHLHTYTSLLPVTSPSSPQRIALTPQDRPLFISVAIPAQFSTSIHSRTPLLRLLFSTHTNRLRNPSFKPCRPPPAMAATFQTERPEDVANKVLRRAQVSKVSLEEDVRRTSTYLYAQHG